MAMNVQAEAFLHQAVLETITPIVHMEKNFNATQIQRMIVDYVGRTAKRVVGTGAKPWRKVAEDFAYKFFESFWKAFGESDWLDQVDFTWIVAAGLRLHIPPPVLASIPDEEFNSVVGQYTALGFDSSRYYSWGAHALKTVIQGKGTQKKVRDAIDNCREDLLKQDFETAENFIAAWVKGTVEKLGGDPTHFLPQATAFKLFNEMVKSGGGVPLWLMQAAGGMTESIQNEIENSVALAYSGFAGSSMGAGMAGPAAFNPSMLAMIAAGGGGAMSSWGAVAGKGKGFGFSPY